MALGVAAVVPPQLAEQSLIKRTEQLNRSIRPGAQQLLAADDAFASVPIATPFARRGLRDKTTVARPTAFAFVPYKGRKIEVRAFVPSTRGGIVRVGPAGLPRQLPILRKHPDDILISRVMAAGLDLNIGDSIELPTAVGPQKLKIQGTVEDFAWPSGTVYMDIRRYRELYRSAAINVLAVDRRRRLDSGSLKDLKPLHAETGVEFSNQIEEQMNKSTKGLFAMRILTLIAALVAVGGIIATSVFARRREWAVLRAMGIGGLSSEARSSAGRPKLTQPAFPAAHLPAGAPRPL